MGLALFPNMDTAERGAATTTNFWRFGPPRGACAPKSARPSFRRAGHLFASMEGEEPSTQIDDELEFVRLVDQERDKVSVGMLSARFQRFEYNVTGKHRGPKSLSDATVPFKPAAALPGSGGGSKTVTSPAVAATSAKLRRHWRVEYGHFFPATHGGNISPRNSHKSKPARIDPHERQYAVHTPRRISFALDEKTREMCEQLGLPPDSMLAPIRQGGVVRLRPSEWRPF